MVVSVKLVMVELWTTKEVRGLCERSCGEVLGVGVSFDKAC